MGQGRPGCSEPAPLREPVVSILQLASPTREPPAGGAPAGCSRELEPQSRSGRHAQPPPGTHRRGRGSAAAPATPLPLVRKSPRPAAWRRRSAHQRGA